MDQLALTGMPRALFRAAPARLTTWLDCPRRYRFCYVDRPPPPKGPAWAHSSFGTTVHNALRRWFDVPVPRRTPAVGRALVDDAWIGDGYRDAEQEAAHRERARDVVERYVATLDVHADPPGLERKVAARHGSLALEGRVDRVDRRGDELVVVDYKTGRAPLRTDDVRGSLALAIYATAAASTLRAPCRTVELHQVTTGEVHSFTHTDDSLQRHLRRAEAIAEEIRAAAESGDYPARPGSACQWCDFVRSCPEGRARVPSIPAPWAALPATA
ncbi:MAG TPA: PD-(D/E)XK nuclease family protein [Mycobacteriales bacterium]|nr:PD-(D/E)XK nuclease family protein [Mycobacteriales bacterium]